MASLLTHGIVAIQLGRATALPLRSKKFWILAVACGLLPDIDVAAMAMNVEDESMFAHGGLTHSLPFALGVALLVTLIAFRDQRPGSRPFWGLVAFFFAVVAAHDLIDAMSVAGSGVALLSPVMGQRYYLPFTPLIAAPLAEFENPGRIGPWLLANESLFVLLPVALVVRLVRQVREPGLRSTGSLARTGVLAGIWILGCVAASVVAPQLIGRPQPRSAVPFATQPSIEQPGGIPLVGLPPGGLVLRYDDLRERGLFERDLAPDADRPPWSSPFFPNWYGGISGRWQDPRPVLVWRTLVGFEAPSADEIRAALDAAKGGDAAGRLFGLAPTEKYDLAVGDYGLAATRQGLYETHNARPRPNFSWGFCNGVAAASLANDEPFRTVDVANPDGYRIRFHPNDVKALLAATWYHTNQETVLGAQCEAIAFDTGASCSMNAGSLVLAVANRIGLARKSFVIQVHPSTRLQYYPVASARLRVARDVYPLDDAHRGVDVDVHMDLSSTVLGFGPPNVLDPKEPDGTHYLKVGVRRIPFDWQATIALDAQGTIIGGRWRGSHGSGPNQIRFTDGAPILGEGGFLDINPHIQSEVVRALYEASIDRRPEREPIDMRALCARVACRPPVHAARGAP